MLLNREFSMNVRVVKSVLIQPHKSVALEMTLNLEVIVPKSVTGTILIAWYMHHSTFKI